MEKIIILDMGGQYAHLLARRIRQLGVYSEILPPDTNPEKIKGAKGIILSGGPSSVYDDEAPQPNTKLFSSGTPILGLCYGHHLIAQHMKGEVRPGRIKEYGSAKIIPKNKNTLLKGLSDEEQVWMSHGDEVKELPEGFSIMASTDDCNIAAMENEDKKIYSFQFHPEVTHTPNGMKMLENFIEKCGCKRDFAISSYLKDIQKKILKDVKGKNVFLLVSGGVDSTVCFALLEKTLPHERIIGLFIDNGLVRKDESENVRKMLESQGFKNFQTYDASKIFLKALENIYDPEKKRRIIGETFIDVQQKVVRELGLNKNEWLIAQGTIYPDTIETKGTKNADLIKTHHNRVPLVQEMIDKGLVIEPLKNLYKDEVRELGKELGLPKEIIWRHPFPGPGLGVRCLCSHEPSNISDESIKDVESVLKDLKIKGNVIPIRSVGVQGDSRTYKNPVAIEHELDYDSLDEISTQITNRCKGINRVLVNLSGDIHKFCIKKEYLTKNRLDILREADSIVTRVIKEKKEYDKIWQFPVVMIPFGKQGESIILRPVTSTEAMTARFAKIQPYILDIITEKIMKLKNIDAVFLDITNKPPGTIEWE